MILADRQLRSSSAERFDYAAGIASGGCTDFDMVWERRGNFLVIENKLPGEEMPLGQLIALRAFAAREGCEVWVAYGNPPDEIVSSGPLDGEQQSMDVVDLRRRIQAWWDGQV